MSRRRSQRYHERRNSAEDEFETPALQIAVEQPPVAPVARLDESDDDQQSESGLGESPEEDLMEEPPSDDDDDDTAANHPESDGSDSAPEEVSFAKSRAAEEKRQEKIKGAIHTGRTEERERRRKRDDLFKLQKQEKVLALNKRKLPEDVLEVLTKPSEKKQKTDKADAEEDKEAPGSEEDGEEEEEEEDFDSEEGDDEAEEFIPLGDTSKEQLSVVSLKSRKGQGQGTPIGGSAADFKDAMLFGQRHKRVTSQEVRLQQAKRLARR